MLAGIRRAVSTTPRRVLRHASDAEHASDADRAPDAGFTLIESLVAIAVIGTVMTALTGFFVTTVSTTGQQEALKAAVQLADDATERVRAVKGSSVAAGRDRTSSNTQWASPVAGVASHLAGMQETWDATAAFPAGATAPLPTTARTSTVNGLAFAQNWYVGKCWQPRGGGACGASQAPGSVELFRVVVAVTWSDKHCASSACSYVTSTLVSSAASEPVFNPNPGAVAPQVTPPGNQVGRVGIPVANLQLNAVGGAAPIVWSAPGLPPGVTVNTNGLIAGTPTASGTYPVTATAIDGLRLVGTATFTWVIGGPPQVAPPASQTTNAGTAVNLPVVAVGGNPPITWTAVGLPIGLTINRTTGVITGTPTTGGTSTVVITATDSSAQTGTATFTWVIVGPPPQPTSPGNQSTNVGTAVNLPMAMTDGNAPIAWSAAGLPPAIVINRTTGVITGTATTVGTYSVAVTVTDSLRRTGTVAFTWSVTNTPQVTNPGNQTSNTGTGVSLSMSATGGSPPYNWTAAGLPRGLSINGSTGVVSGTPNLVGTFAVTVTARDRAGARATASFTWTIVAPPPVPTNPGNQATTRGSGVNLRIAVTNGTAPITWTASGLPIGLSINRTTGVITGTPTAPGTYPVSVTATDAGGRPGTTAFTWTINASPQLTSPGNQSTVRGRGVSLAITCTGGTGPLTWTVNRLPTGLSINRNTGVITGTPRTNGTTSVIVTVTDASGQQATTTFNWTIT